MSNEIVQYRPRTAVELRRELANNPAVISVLDPLEKAVFLASTAKTFAEYTANELAADLTKALRFIFKDTGYRSTDETELGYLVVRVCEIVKRYYPGLTLKDFRMAFEMSITGELDDYLPKGRDGQADRGHYQQFNAEYVCKILNAYKVRRAWVLKKANDAKPEPEKTVDPAKKEEYRKHAVRELIAHYDIFKETGKLITSPLLDVIFYNILTEYGLSIPVEITDEERKYVLQQAINDYARRGMVGDLNRLKQQGTAAPELTNSAFSLARHNALKTVFEQMCDAGDEITDYIKID